MVSSSPLGDYLRARRAALQPADVGLTALPGRRVEGLRRDEVARLAGISQEYYLRLEQGRDRQPSEQVLFALTRAMKLDNAAVAYMRRLVEFQAGGSRADDPRRLTEEMDRSLGSMLEQWAQTPAYIVDRNQTVVMSNPLAAALLPGILEPGISVPIAVFGSAWREMDRDWEETARRTVASLRFNSDPDDRELQRIVGVLAMRDPDFRRLWARHEAHPHYVSPARLTLQGFGLLDFTRQTLLIPGHRRHVLTVLHAEADTVAADAVRALLSAEVNTRAGAGERIRPRDAAIA
ncbi:helix-turn-helix domain-containing protein [Herbiconiux moechotypicola]|uniref:Helix-turn-helix transcriptional regulator n=1 Tax=Herbiconiux moechotypicola TaxID=637393 RepID=A0ABN3DEG1_9MICO|nr:helix-turn-helix domain-containing protein [Herbiconiux moechotypicola]MCS5729301.1 helix-turn-helix domain-containing protein [Herbiconiux moechotypicola]